MNYRPDYRHGWWSKTYYTQLRLDPLPPASANTFLLALLGVDPSLAPLTLLLIQRTEGNPFFLEESVRTLVETGVLVGKPGAYRVAHALPTIQVPATVQAVLAARIDRLSPEEKRLLQTAAGWDSSWNCTSELMRGKPNNDFPPHAHHLKTARHFGALNVQVSTQSKIVAL